MPRVSIDSIDVLEELLRDLRSIHEQLEIARDDTYRRHELKREELAVSFHEATGRLEVASAEESRLNAEISSATDAIESLSDHIDSLESRL